MKGPRNEQQIGIRSEDAGADENVRGSDSEVLRKVAEDGRGRVLGRQLLRAGTSVAANYRAVCRAKSDADFIHKLGTVVEETDESLLWLELLDEAGLCPAAQTAALKSEADELVRILQTSLNTAKRNPRR